MKFLNFCIPAILYFSCNGLQNKIEDTPPNILFAIADDASYPHMSAYGCKWINTPAFDRVAREGLLFTNAYTPNAKCAPSRSMLLTGRNTWQLEEAANHNPYFPEKFKTYAEALEENGYFVGFTGKGWGPGKAGTLDGKPRNLAGKAYNSKKTVPPANGISSHDYAENFKDFLQQRPDGKPFCFWYGGTEPHRRYEYGSGINKGGKTIDQIQRVPAYWPDNDTVRTDILDYAFELEYFDNHLVKMLEFLETTGELDNTIVIVTADNGMPFPRAKGAAYERSVHMPLAIMWKNGIKNPGRVVDDFVSFIDFAPTYLELAGIDQAKSGMQKIEGKSLMDIFISKKSGTVTNYRNYVLLGQERHDVGRPNDEGYPVRGIIKDNFLYLHNYKPDRWPQCNPETGYLNSDGGPAKTQVLRSRTKAGQELYWTLCFAKRQEEELYNLADDPDCMNNLADIAQYAETKNSLRGFLEKELTRQEDPRILGNGDIFDKYPYSEEKMRNFYEKYMNGEDLNPGWVSKTDFEKIE